MILALAMSLALLANVTLLPALLVLTHGKRPENPAIRTDVALMDRGNA